MQVQQHAAAFGRDQGECRIALRRAVAAHRMQRVAGETLAVDAHEHVFAVADIAHHHRDVRDAIDLDDSYAMPRNSPVRGRQIELRDARDELLVAHPVGDQVFDRDQLAGRASSRIRAARRGASSCRLRP
jgi:hypothetical protein